MSKVNMFNSDLFPMEGASDKEAEVLRDKILDSDESLPDSVTGRVWYISAFSGYDGNSGKAKNQAWKTAFAIDENADKIKAGDAVLFEREGVYRGTFRTKSGVFYGAYGNGYKPCLYGSDRSFHREIDWKMIGENLWMCTYKFSSDVGVVVFNHGDLVGFKRHSKSDLSRPGDFWCDPEDNFRLYVYLDEEPWVYPSIEIGLNRYIIGVYDNSENVIIDNLCIRYTGSHAIAMADCPKNITVKNCEIGFVGGSYIGSAILGQYTRFGNAIEFYGQCENILIEDNWLYQVYDSGVTFQGGGSYVSKNLTIRNNLIEYCGMGSVEYWLWYDKSKGDYCYADNVLIENNVMRFAGYCWGGEQRPDKVSAHILSNGPNHNHIKNYVIRGNTFDQSTQDLVEITSLDGVYPSLEGNTYIQKEGLRLGSFADKRDILFDTDVAKMIKKEWGDRKANVVYHKSETNEE